MKPGQKAVRTQKGHRELSDKELNEITRAFGDQVRAQTIEQKERMKASLRKGFDLVRAKSASRSK